MWRATSYRAHSQFAWKSSVPPGDALSRREMSGFYCGERPQLLTASGLRSRPNIAACIRGWAAHRGVAAAHRGRVGAHAAGPAAFAHAHGLITARLMRAGRCVRASRSPSGLCRAAHV